MSSASIYQVCNLSRFLGTRLISSWQNEQAPFLGQKEEHYECANTNYSQELEKYYVCGNVHLGPQKLPWHLPLLGLVTNYKRFGGLSPGAFLDEYFNKTNGRWLYPVHDGFHLNTSGLPINGTMTLKVGTRVDRFGETTGRQLKISFLESLENVSTFKYHPLSADLLTHDCFYAGKFVSAADAPFDQRSLPPESLNIPKNATRNGADHPWGYHVYNVTREMNVSGGPIAPHFGQPGLGAQFYVGHIGNIQYLMDHKYLEPLKISIINKGMICNQPKGKSLATNPFLVEVDDAGIE